MQIVELRTIVFGLNETLRHFFSSKAGDTAYYIPGTATIRANTERIVARGKGSKVKKVVGMISQRGRGEKAVVKRMRVWLSYKAQLALISIWFSRPKLHSNWLLSQRAKCQHIGIKSQHQIICWTGTVTVPVTGSRVLATICN